MIGFDHTLPSQSGQSLTLSNALTFIFKRYEYNQEGEIDGMRVADQGLHNRRLGLVPKDYWDVWYGANIGIKVRALELFKIE